MAFNKTRALQEAERSLAQGRISEATQQYLEIVESDPSDLAVINLAGDLCVRAHNTPEALKLFRRLAEAYVYEGHVPRAIAIYKKILKLESSNVDAMLKLAGLYTVQGLIHEARDLYAQALVVCQDQNLQEKALEVMRRIAAGEPTNVTHRLRLADLYKAAGQTEDAFKGYLEAADVALTGSNLESASIAMEQAATLRPDDPRLRELRARLSPPPPASEEAAASAIEAEPTRGETPMPAEPVADAVPVEFDETEPPAAAGPSVIDLSEEWEATAAGQAAPGGAEFDFDDLLIEIGFYRDYGMPQKAIERLERLEQQFPGNAHLAEIRQWFEKSHAAADAHAGSVLGETAAPRNPLQGRERVHSEALPARGPGANTDFAASLGALLSELGNEDRAVAPEGDPQVHYELGIAFREMGLVDEAIGELQKAARRTRPGADRERYLSVCNLLALCFVEKQMPVLAAKWYTRALKVPGLDPDAILALQYDLGVAYELAGNLEAARENFLEVYGQKIDYRDVAARIRHLPAHP